MKHIYLSILSLLLATNILAQLEPAFVLLNGFGGDSTEGINSISRTPDNGFILGIGTASVNGNIDFSCNTSIRSSTLFRKYTADGIGLEWQKCYKSSADSTYTYAIQLNDGSLLLGGYSALGAREWRLRKEDANGNCLWTKTFGGSGDDHLGGMISTNDGGIIMYGYSNSNDGDVGTHHGSVFSWDIWLLKLDINGNIQWSKVYGGSSDEWIYNVVEAPNGYYIAGATASNDFDFASAGYHGAGDASVIRIDNSGNIIWSKCYGGSQMDGFIVSACSDKKGGIILANGSESSDGDITHANNNTHYWVLNVDSNSNIIWNQIYQHAYSDVPRSVCLSTDNTIWIGGQSAQLSANGGNSFIIHTDINGNIISELAADIQTDDEADILFPLQSDMVLTAGMYYGPGNIGNRSLNSWLGDRDIYLGILAPWTTGIKSSPSGFDNAIVFPNPAKDQLNIRVISGEQVRIFDAMGKVYQTIYPIDGTTVTIDVKEWPRGIYFVQLTGDQSEIRKTILQ